jgi:hypothetical protein
MVDLVTQGLSHLSNVIHRNYTFSSSLLIFLDATSQVEYGRFNIVLLVGALRILYIFCKLF